MKIDKPKAEFNPIRSPLRVMEILLEIAKQEQPISLATISARLNAPKSTVHGILRSLESGNMIASSNGQYRISVGAFRLASAISRHTNPLKALHPLLEKYQKSTRETVIISVPTADWMNIIVTDVVETDNPLRFTVEVDQEYPAYATAGGILMAALSPAEVQDHFINNSKLAPLTTETIRRKGDLRAEMDRARQQGYLTSGAFIQESTSVAAAVMGAQGVPVAAVSVAGPTSRIQNHLHELVELTVATGHEMSAIIG